MSKQAYLTLIFLIMLTGCAGTAPKLGINDGKLMSCPKTPNCINSQATDEKHSIHPLQYADTQQEARERLLQILTSEKRTTILVSQQNYIRVEFTSALFHFIDDTEFYFPKERESDKVIHIRSAARLGYFDFGANRKRIEKIRIHLTTSSLDTVP